MKKNYLLYLFSVLFAFTIGSSSVNAQSPSANNILYVNQNATGDGSGDSWTNAIPQLADALKWAKQNETQWTAAIPLKIYLAKGTYKPMYSPADDNFGNPAARDNSFLLVNNVKLYGGFIGTEATLADRNLSLTANASILSGDFGNINVNAYHVLISEGDMGTAELNGFTVKGGNANGGGSITVNSKVINRNSGGGIYNNNSSPVLSNVSISGNTATSVGGGIYNNNSSPVLTNVSISENIATTAGGGIYNSSSSPVLTNVSISGNISTGTGSGWGGGIGNNSSSPVLTNTTISRNIANRGGGIYNNNTSNPQVRNSIIYGNNSGIFNVANSASAPVFLYSLVQGLTDLNDGNFKDNINGNTDPQFVDATNGNYSLAANSPAINNGNNTYFDAGQTPDLSAISTDIAGNARKQKGSVDLGAYESPYSILLAPDVNGIIYVTAAGAGSKNGNSWTNASNDLQLSMNATGVQQVWVAKGTYKPKYPANDMSTTDPTNRDNAFVLKKDVKVYGGFAGTETSLAGRNLTITANASILSGDLGTVDTNTDNACHVVISAGDVGIAELNGFTVKDGNANTSGTITINTKTIDSRAGGGIYNHSSSPVLSNITISGNMATNFGGGIYNTNTLSAPILSNVSISSNTAHNGGGIFNDDNSTPILSNVIISSNTANGLGGGISNNFSSPILTNVIISSNTATNGNGGGIYNNSSSPVLTNVTISRNTAGGIYNSNTISKPKIRNSIIYGNNSGISGSGTPAISYSLVQGLSSAADGNIPDTDPKFVDAPNGNYSLAANSPAINKGKSTYFDAGQTPDLNAITTDITGNTRIQKGNIDMGAYESPYSTPLAPNASGIIYVTATGAGNKSGNSWTNASDDLQMAINATNVQQVWVAKGTYKSKYPANNMSTADPNNRNNAFVLKNNVKVYGGFAGTEAALAIRDLTLSTNASILSGDIGNENDDTDNAYHVVISANAVGTAELNGFTIKHGNANSYDFITVNSKDIMSHDGGGIYNASSSPVLTNVTITENTTINNGGGILNDASSPVLTNVSISANTANESGGGIHNISSSTPVLNHVSISTNTANGGGGISNDYSSPVLTNVTISENTITNNGGGISNYYSSPVLTHVTISKNTANGIGGGIYNYSSSPNLTNVTISENTANESGGGILNDTSSPVITNVTISGNTTVSGGGIFNYSSFPVLTNVTISENTATYFGGGIFNNSSSPVLTNVTISKNTANENGGGIYNFNLSSNPKIRNSIIYGNNSGIYGGTPVVSYSLVQGLTDTNNGNIDGSTNPQFVDASTGDFSLKNTSTLINKGSDTYFDAGQTPDLNAIITDIAGNPRIIETTIDMGAYEYQTPLPVSLINFTAKADGNRAKLEWQTVAETNNALFIVYRSSNGEDFTAIDQKAGLGTSATGGNYLLYDNSPLNGTNYYKLVQVDKDGTSTELEIRVLRFTLSAISFKLYPNPAKDYVNMEFETDRYSTVQLHNIQGQLLQEVKLQANQSALKVSVEDLSAGVYYVTLTGKGEREVKKLVIAK